MTWYPIGSQGNPFGIATGPDGTLWFTVHESGVDWVGRVTQSGVVTRFPLGNPGSRPGPILHWPDGNLWFAMADGLGRMTPAGAVTVVPLTTTLGVPAIAVGPDSAPSGSRRTP